MSDLDLSYTPSLRSPWDGMWDRSASLDTGQPRLQGTLRVASTLETSDVRDASVVDGENLPTIGLANVGLRIRPAFDLQPNEYPGALHHDLRHSSSDTFGPATPVPGEDLISIVTTGDLIARGAPSDVRIEEVGETLQIS